MSSDNLSTRKEKKSSTWTAWMTIVQCIMILKIPRYRFQASFSSVIFWAAWHIATKTVCYSSLLGKVYLIMHNMFRCHSKVCVWQCGVMSWVFGNCREKGLWQQSSYRGFCVWRLRNSPLKPSCTTQMPLQRVALSSSLCLHTWTESDRTFWRDRKETKEGERKRE